MSDLRIVSLLEFPNYEVTTFGQVWSVKYKKFLSPLLCGRDRNYHQVILSKNRVRVSKFVHRLVAEAFLPNSDNKPQVNHIDGNSLNNVLANLEWVSAKQNNRHMVHLLASQGKSKYSNTVVPTEEQVRIICTDLQRGVPRKNILAKHPELKPHTIANIQQGWSWTDISAEYGIQAKKRVKR